MYSRDYSQGAASSSSSSSHGFITGLLCGAAVGAAVGLLFAPSSGAEMRSSLSSSADRLRKRAASGYADASASVNDMWARGRNAVRQGKAAFNEAIDEVQSAASSAASSVSQPNGHSTDRS